MNLTYAITKAICFDTPPIRVEISDVRAAFHHVGWDVPEYLKDQDDGVHSMTREELLQLNEELPIPVRIKQPVQKGGGLRVVR